MQTTSEDEEQLNQAGRMSSFARPEKEITHYRKREFCDKRHVCGEVDKLCGENFCGSCENCIEGAGISKGWQEGYGLIVKGFEPM